jgi:hypothetical protein
MSKTQIYLPENELRALRELGRKYKRSVTDLARQAIRETWLRKLQAGGPVALWSKPVKHSSIEHDAIYDEVAAK